MPKLDEFVNAVFKSNINIPVNFNYESPMKSTPITPASVYLHSLQAMKTNKSHFTPIWSSFLQDEVLVKSIAYHHATCNTPLRLEDTIMLPCDAIKGQFKTNELLVLYTMLEQTHCVKSVLFQPNDLKSKETAAMHETSAALLYGLAHWYIGYLGPKYQSVIQLEVPSNDMPRLISLFSTLFERVAPNLSSTSDWKFNELTTPIKLWTAVHQVARSLPYNSESFDYKETMRLFPKWSASFLKPTIAPPCSPDGDIRALQQMSIQKPLIIGPLTNESDNPPALPSHGPSTLDIQDSPTEPKHFTSNELEGQDLFDQFQNSGNLSGNNTFMEPQPQTQTSQLPSPTEEDLTIVSGASKSPQDPKKNFTPAKKRSPFVAGIVLLIIAVLIALWTLRDKARRAVASTETEDDIEQQGSHAEKATITGSDSAEDKNQSHQSKDLTN